METTYRLPRYGVEDNLLPEIRFTVSEALKGKSDFDEGDGQFLKVNEFEHVGKHLFDIPFDLLTNTLSSISERKISIEEIDQIKGSVLITGNYSTVFGYSAILRTGEKLKFTAEVLRSPSENYDRTVSAMNKVKVLRDTRLSDEAKKFFDIQVPIESGSVEFDGRHYKFYVLNETDNNLKPIILNNADIFGMPVLAIYTGVIRGNGVMRYEDASPVLARRFSTRSDKILNSLAKSPKNLSRRFNGHSDDQGRAELDEITLDAQMELLQSTEYQAYKTFSGSIKSDMLKTYALLYALTEGRFTDFYSNAGQFFGYIKHGQPTTYFLTGMDELSQPVSTDDFIRRLREHQERGFDTSFFQPFEGVTDNEFLEALEWAKSQLVAETSPYFWG